MSARSSASGGPAAGAPLSVADAGRILTPEAIAFLARLERAFGSRRTALLAARATRQSALDAGAVLDFLPDTRAIRDDPSWRVAPAPPDLERRHVEITGPTDRKMLINALNSGADVFMADFEDANAPTWPNLIEGQANLIDAIDGRLEFTSPEGKSYRLDQKVAVLLVRPRGWHLHEKHLLVDGRAMSASLFDFGLYFFHNHARLRARGTGPYFYLPKMESHLEARLWNDVFVEAQAALGVPRGTIRATVLIETIPAAFEMEEILYELRDHASGLNAGRWDYMFSAVKKFRNRPGFMFPDRGQVTMTAPFLRAYALELVRACHRREAHAIGGMAAFIPSRRDPEVNATALAKVREDKERETGDGFDGTWVAHPDLVPVARAIFDARLGSRQHQKEKRRDAAPVAAAALTDFTIPGGAITERGVRQNISVALRYVEAWLRGLGAVAIDNLMEDTATAEISRAQLWQWVHRGARLDDGRPADAGLYRRLADEEMARLLPPGSPAGRFPEARAILDRLVLDPRFVDFLTLETYNHFA
ncbi:MAG TPA: malate synthase A [Dongiaceae bacterium]|nr:malate synthase A [Dongiaceae bacterium]